MQKDESTISVVIEVPRGGLAKRRLDGSIEFVAPVPCPFNYGSIVGRVAADGDPEDALVLGARLRRGETIEVQVWGRVRFMDAGCVDDKWVCGAAEPTALERRMVTRFFKVYGGIKRGVNRLRGRSGPTGFVGYDSTRIAQ